MRVSPADQAVRDQLIAASETASYFAAALIKCAHADPIARDKAANFLNRGQLLAFSRDGNVVLDGEAPRLTVHARRRSV